MNKFFALLVLSILLLLLTACPKSGQPGGAAAAEPQTPQEIGKAVGDIYPEAMQKLVDLTRDKPAFAEVKPKIAELKESYVQKLVPLGRKREALSTADKAAADMVIQSALSGIPPALFSEFSALQSHYAAQDPQTGVLMSSFNIITQYASFELLKKQEPKEAERLGIQ